MIGKIWGYVFLVFINLINLSFAGDLCSEDAIRKRTHLDNFTHDLIVGEELKIVENNAKLKLTLQPKKDTFKQGEPVIIFCTWTNISKDTVTQQFPNPHFSILDGEGKSLSRPFRGEQRFDYSGVIEVDKEKIKSLTPVKITLMPGEDYQFEKEIFPNVELNDKSDSFKPGKYKVALYSGHDSYGMYKGQAISETDCYAEPVNYAVFEVEE